MKASHQICLTYSVQVLRDYTQELKYRSDDNIQIIRSEIDQVISAKKTVTLEMQNYLREFTN